jgi:hypothetical protein
MTTRVFTLSSPEGYHSTYWHSKVERLWTLRLHHDKGVGSTIYVLHVYGTRTLTPRPLTRAPLAPSSALLLYLYALWIQCMPYGCVNVSLV